MKNNSLIAFLLLLFFQNTFSQVSPELQARWDKESSVPENPLLDHRPTVLPDRITLVPRASNNDEIAVVWRTDTLIKEGTLELVKGDDYSFPKANRKRITASYEVVQYKDYPMHYHKAIISGLESGKIYRYRVGKSPHWSAWNTYVHENHTDTLKLLYFGDTQNGIYKHAKRIYKEAFRKFGQAQLAVYVGDMINHANNDYEWAEWHTSTADINATIPVIAAPGNHEYLKNLEGKKIKLSNYWTSTFPYPYSWDAGQYYLDYGFVRFIVMNSNEKLHEQGKWLEQILSETEQDWVVIVAHHPVFSGAKKRINKGLLENWLPVIEKHKDKIGLVLQGHDHTYARGGLENRTGTKEKPSQPVFTVTVVGDKYYDLDEQSWMDVSYSKVSSYQYIEITKSKITYKAMSEANTLIDEFVIEKKKTRKSRKKSKK
ncbi:purple acid phosphatase family protein [Capnocytophaga cynodegmi]|uniref:Ser/Thr phosphatase family protein n=1 Tax=Capnocytophaga cynodegmi TaxID=28189 RepID=A0A0B7H0P3_9FLAO|nr:metallophosphoesterase family protein [Capnocytophaga cynodegmi]GIM54507.1 phosphoesterase [Capnocytophaga cynodegmi]CEN33111.1 Ser/Thr phosphatase family protein [Capnocytophaga cynodegmi]